MVLRSHKRPASQDAEELSGGGGLVITALGTVLGYLMARRLFGESCRYLAASLAPLLGMFYALLSGALLLRWLPWTPWMLLTAACMAGGIWKLKGLPSPQAFRKLSPWCLVYLVPGIATVLVFSLFHQSVGMVVDGDFFIHGANIGLFARGYLPPVNPYLGVPMHGHYGRDLAIAIFVRDTGLNLLTAEWVLTTLWQSLTFLVLFFWLRREFDDDLVGMLGSGMAFFGMNFSAYAGLCELLANNNPIAFCLMVTTSWAVFRARDSGPLVWLMAALLLGLDAVIYETHFGVMGLALAVGLRKPRATLSIGLLALLTAALLSGVVRSTAVGAEESGAEQTIRMRVFKEKLFCLRADNLRPCRAFETRARPWTADFAPSSEYWPLWSRQIQDTFWYPVWLLPFSTLFLAWQARRQGSPVGLWWAAIAWFSLLTPALADFGVFEAETARWLAVTALGAAIATGISLSQLWRLWPTLGRPLTFVLVALCSFGFKLAATDMLDAFRHPGQPLPVGRPGLPPGNGLLPNPQRALEYHYGISADVLDAAAWIREHSEPGQHFICDSWDLPTNARGALVGAVGLLPAMEADPPVHSRSIDSYQPNLQQRGFWATGDPMRLDHQVNWLLVSRSPQSFGTPVYQAGEARVYRVPERDDPPSGGSGPFSLRFQRRGLPGSHFQVHYDGPLGCLFQLRFHPLGSQEFVADENIQSTAAEPTMLLIAPYVDGEYRVEVRLSRDVAWQDFGTFTAVTIP
jgi:hypothetical protein